MITLFAFGPAFGLPDPSPFVTKAEVLLKLAGLPYRVDTSGFAKAPKGKLPYIEDDGTTVADSTFIRWHLEQRHGADFDIGLSAPEKATAWAFEKLMEDHVYWGVMHDRWMNKDNFDRGPRNFFKAVPAPLRPLVIYKVGREFKRSLWGHGMGRHDEADIVRLTAHAVRALSDFLGDKPYLMGQTPCGADASVFAFVAGLLCDTFPGPIRDAAACHPNLVAYRDRCMRDWFPDLSSRPSQ